MTNTSTFVKVVLGALGGVVLTLAPVAIFSGGPMISGAPMMNNGMLGGAAMVVMLLVGAAILFAWLLGLAAVVGLAIWGVRKLSARGGSGSARLVEDP